MDGARRVEECRWTRGILNGRAWRLGLIKEGAEERGPGPSQLKISARKIILNLQPFLTGAVERDHRIAAISRRINCAYFGTAGRVRAWVEWAGRGVVIVGWVWVCNE